MTYWKKLWRLSEKISKKPDGVGSLRNAGGEITCKGGSTTGPLN